MAAPAPACECCDEQRIVRTLYDYAAGIDSRDWELYRSVFAPEIEIDFSSFNGRAPLTIGADAWVAAGRPMFEALTATHHAMSNPRVRQQGDTAECRMYVRADHVVAGEGSLRQYTIVGEYLDRLVRDGSAWRLTGVTLTVRWEQGDRSILDLGPTRGSRDATG